MANARKQPILVGTTSIEKSEILADLLKARTKIPFTVLNARHHEKEAHIVAEAGVPGAVTIATNMAGRGTDIQLGGNFEMRLEQEIERNPDMDKEVLAKQVREEIDRNRQIVLEAGGLYILGSERHESRRIDNQLRGRAGRQGDPGLSKFYVSLEDDLMRIFGSERIGAILKNLGMPKGQAIVHPWISSAIAKAQQKVEAYHFDVRKNLLKYDDVMNDQRKVIYEQRKELMSADSVTDMIKDMREDCIANLVYSYAPAKTPADDWDVGSLIVESEKLLGINAPLTSWAAEPGITSEDITHRLGKMADEAIEQKMALIPVETRNELEKSMLIQTIDQNWKEHLQMLDFMRMSIGLRAYGQKNPLNEYKRESFISFENMLNRVRERITTLLCNARFEVRKPEPVEMKEEHKSVLEPNVADDRQEPAKQTPAVSDKTPRNAPCPCGSGKKYKHCCGKIS